MKTEFIKRESSIWVSVNDCGTTFDVCKYGKPFLAESWRKCEQKAADWLVDECNRQNRHQSFAECEFSASRLATLVGIVQHDFPLTSDFAFVVDDFAESVGVLFGSIFVTESDFGFNIELIVNWRTKQRAVVCKNVSLDVAAGIVCGSENSRSFSDTDSRRLFFTNRNRKFLREVLQIN